MSLAQIPDSRQARKHVLTVRHCLLQGLDDTVILEPAVGHGAEFSCVVIDTPKGPVALPPTEFGVYDLEHDILNANIDMERHAARIEVRAAAA